eukprot:4440349-Amphidinium_carterae.1
MICIIIIIIIIIISSLSTWNLHATLTNLSITCPFTIDTGSSPAQLASIGRCDLKSRLDL